MRGAVTHLTDVAALAELGTALQGYPLNEILGKQVILGNKNKLVDEYYGLIFTEYSNEY